MKVTKHGNYSVLSINEVDIKNLALIIKDAFKISNKLSMDAPLDFGETLFYKTQIPYSSGYIQERYVYYITNSLIRHILPQMKSKEVSDSFFCHYVCFDFYDGHNLILSINFVQDLVSINSHAIDLTKYDIEMEPNNE